MHSKKCWLPKHDKGRFHNQIFHYLLWQDLTFSTYSLQCQARCSVFLSQAALLCRSLTVGTSNTVLTVGRIPRAGCNPNRITGGFLQLALKQSTTSIKAPQMQTADLELVKKRALCPCSFSLVTWMYTHSFGLYQRFGVDILSRTAIIHIEVPEFVPAQRKPSLAIQGKWRFLRWRLLCRCTIMSFFTLIRNLHDEALSLKPSLPRVLLWVKISTYTQTAALLNYRGVEIMSVENHHNFVQRSCCHKCTKVNVHFSWNHELCAHGKFDSQAGLSAEAHDCSLHFKRPDMGHIPTTWCPIHVGRVKPDSDEIKQIYFQSYW